MKTSFGMGFPLRLTRPNRWARGLRRLPSWSQRFQRIIEAARRRRRPKWSMEDWTKKKLASLELWSVLFFFGGVCCCFFDFLKFLEICCFLSASQIGKPICRPQRSIKKTLELNKTVCSMSSSPKENNQKHFIVSAIRFLSLR